MSMRDVPGMGVGVEADEYVQMKTHSVERCNTNLVRDRARGQASSAGSQGSVATSRRTLIASIWRKAGRDVRWHETSDLTFGGETNGLSWKGSAVVVMALVSDSCIRAGLAFLSSLLGLSQPHIRKTECSIGMPKRYFHMQVWIYLH